MTPATEVRERPILFSGAMVLAILEGRKTVTRRIIKPQPDFSNWSEPEPPTSDLVNEAWQTGHVDAKCPHGKPGDSLWVRERWSKHIQPLTAQGHTRGREFCVFPDGGQTFSWCKEYHPGLAEYHPGAFDGCKWRPSIFMPRWASRITLQIDAVRVERLDQITEEDARAEGVERQMDMHGRDPRGSGDIIVSYSYREPFKALWDSINGKAAPWATSPFVWVLSFHQIEASR